MKQRRYLRLLLTLAGIAVGVWHLDLALRALFVFRESEPVSSWIAVSTGPLTTLVATLVGSWQRKIGGTWLIVSGAIALISFVIGEGALTARTFQYALLISAPMTAIGTGFLWLRNRDEAG
jgi:hypothetical protein